MNAMLSSSNSKPNVVRIIDPRQVPYITLLVSLNDGTRLPRIGLGTRAMNDLEAQAAVSAAMRIGYRLVDTASVDGNELGVGRGIRASGVPREQIFLASTLRSTESGYSDTLRAFDASVERLGTDYIDLCLLTPQENALSSDSWRALIRLKAEGRVRSIGVSNFLPQEIERLVSESGAWPSLNQIEIHPGYPQHLARAWHARTNIRILSCSPLSRGRLFGHPLIERLAQKHGRDPAQILLRWYLQQGLVAIHQSQDPPRMRLNLNVFDFALDAADLGAISTLDNCQPQCSDHGID